MAGPVSGGHYGVVLLNALVGEQHAVATGQDDHVGTAVAYCPGKVLLQPFDLIEIPEDTATLLPAEEGPVCGFLTGRAGQDQEDFRMTRGHPPHHLLILPVERSTNSASLANHGPQSVQ